MQGLISSTERAFHDPQNKSSELSPSCSAHSLYLTLFISFKWCVFVLLIGNSALFELTIGNFVCLQAHLVAAFEKSLSNMTCRLQSLTMTAEQKVPQLPVQNLKRIAYEVGKQWLETGNWGKQSSGCQKRNGYFICKLQPTCKVIPPAQTTLLKYVYKNGSA